MDRIITTKTSYCYLTELKPAVSRWCMYFQPIYSTDEGLN